MAQGLGFCWARRTTGAGAGKVLGTGSGSWGARRCVRPSMASGNSLGRRHASNCCKQREREVRNEGRRGREEGDGREEVWTMRVRRRRRGKERQHGRWRRGRTAARGRGSGRAPARERIEEASPLVLDTHGSRQGDAAASWLGGGANRGRWSERDDWPGAEIEEKVGGGARVGSLEIRGFVSV